jgi:muramidase (phage lysozyme)
MNGRNLRAFLDMLASSEGTAGLGDDGYNVLVGSRSSMPILFGSYRDHPRVRIQLRADDRSTPQNEELTSTAAGRYQVLARYFDAYRRQLNLADFGPASQDAIAVQLIRECGALQDIEAGRFDSAVTKCRSRWASLPGAGYGQHENSLAALRAAYTKAGGMFA